MYDHFLGALLHAPAWVTGTGGVGRRARHLAARDGRPPGGAAPPRSAALPSKIAAMGEEDNHPQKGAPRGFRAWLRHAFAVDNYEESSLSDEEKDILDSLARRIHKKRMASPAIIWVESHRHFNWLGSQLLIVFQPVYDMSQVFLNPLLRHLGIYVSPGDIIKLASVMEKRYSVEYFIQRLEAYAAGGYNGGPAEARVDEGQAAVPPARRDNGSTTQD